MRVLVADNDLEFLELIAKVLDQSGLEVVCARTGNELLRELIESTPFDVVITDASMPWKTGLQIIQSEWNVRLPCPLVIMTEQRDHTIAAQAAALSERVTFLHKPFSIGALRIALQTCLGSEMPRARSCG